MKRSIAFLLIFIFFITSGVARESVDIHIDITEKEITPDNPLRFQVTTFRVGEKREDISFKYFIAEGNEIRFIKSESVAIEKMSSFFREIELSPKLHVGEKTLIVQVTNKGTITEAKETFSIVKTEEFIEISQTFTHYLLALLIIIIAFFLIFIIWDYRLTYRLIKSYNKIEKKDFRGEI